MNIPGVGPDVPIVTAPNGAKQSDTPYRFDLMDPKAMFELAYVLSYGAKKYGDDNWRGLPVNDHLNHALQHIYAYLGGDYSDNHLAHALCRMLFAVALDG